MTRVFSSIILILYVLVVVRPAAPLFDYAVNVEYIAAELCENKNLPESTCNGKCHLNDQLKEAQDANESEQKSTTPKIETPPIDGLQTFYLAMVTVPNTLGAFKANPSCEHKEYIADVPTPPPEICC